MPQPTTPSPTPRRGVYRAVVAANEPLCADHYRLALDVGAGFPPTRPGQFVQVQCASPEPCDTPLAHDWPEGQPPRLEQPEVLADRALLRRPFSLAGRRDEHNGRVVLELIHRVVGVGTAWLTGLAAGDAVSVLGPLGNAFTWSADTRAVLVGGGVGIPPMLYLAEALARAGRPTVAMVGATARRLLPLTLADDAQPDAHGRPTPCVREFARHGIPAAVCTDDGSLGMAGLVTEALWAWIDAQAAPAGLVVYTCGPEPMMRAIAAGCQRRGISCQVALERQMACGMGTCQSCVCKVRTPDEAGWQYRLVCTDGTVFNATDLLWDEPDTPHSQREEHGKARPTNP